MFSSEFGGVFTDSSLHDLLKLSTYFLKIISHVVTHKKFVDDHVGLVN